LILIYELTLEVGHMGGGNTVVGIFGDGVQIRVGNVWMIHIGDVLMSHVGDVRMILVCDVPIHVVGCLIL
jgi:hypothetical protein